MNKLSTTDNKLYIVELKSPFERLEIQFMPNEVPISRRANISDVQVVGRNNPLRHHTGGDKSLVLNLDFYSEEDDRQDVLRKVYWLESLTYNNGANGPARTVKLVWGRQLFRKEIWLVNSVDIILSNFHSRYDMVPIQAQVSIELKIDTETQDVVFEDVRNY